MQTSITTRAARRRVHADTQPRPGPGGDAVVDYAIGGQGQDIAAGDFNGDGRLDLVVTINNPQIGLSLLAGAIEDLRAHDRPVRLARPAAAVLWLCSAGASFVIGVALPVDRGYTAA